MKNFLFCLTLLFMIATTGLAQTNDNNGTATEWSKRKAKKWFKKKDWAMGLAIKPHASIDVQAFAKAYHEHPERWQKAFAFMRDSVLANLKPGRYNIDGNDVYATITEGPLKTMEASSYEAHKKYADIQIAVSGSEQIGVAPYTNTTVKTPFNDAGDIGYYNADGTFYEATPEIFFIFFPEKDAHRPGVETATSKRDKKLVIKVRVN